MNKTKHIEPYNEAWSISFDELKNVLLSELAEYDIGIEHVGSTAIPHLHAKPIIDIDLVICDKTMLEGVSERLKRLGYRARGDQGIAGRFAFRQTSESTPQTKPMKKWPQHHLYVCYSDSLALKNHLMFRDALLADERLVAQYATLKINLANQEGMTADEYTRRRTDFIISVLTAGGLTQDELHDITNVNT